MAVEAPAVGPDAWEARSGPKQWDKNSQDIIDSEESFVNARDLGMVRNEYTRLGAVSALTEGGDTTDFFKVNVVSTGKLRLTVRDSGDGTQSEKKPLDLQKYDDYMDGLDIPGYTKEEEEATAEETEETKDEGPLDLSKYDKYLEQFKPEEEEATQSDVKLDDENSKTLEEYEDVVDQLTAKGVRVQLFSHNGYRGTLIADNEAEEGSEEKQAFDSLSKGEYKMNKKGDYYIKVTRQEDVDQDATYQYALQIQMGEGYEHDYLTTEVEGEAQPSNGSGVGNVNFSTATAMTSYASSVSALSMINSFNAAQATSAGGASSMLSAATGAGGNVAGAQSAMSGAVMAGNSANSLLVGGYNSMNALTESGNGSNVSLFG